MSAEEQQQRVAYCQAHNIHHLFELLATKVLVDRPENPFSYLREMLQSVEESEKKKGSYDPTQIRFQHDEEEREAAPVPSSPSHHPPAAGGGAVTQGTRATSEKRRRITLGTFGLDNAGKTTLLSALGGNVDVNCTPTVGFTPVQFSTSDFDVCIFDLGGATNFRGIWVHYFHDCHGLIYVVDSAAEEKVLMEALEVFKETAGHPYMRGKPVLVLDNKKDLPTSRVHADEAASPPPPSLMPQEVRAAVVPAGTPFREVATCGIREDAVLESGVEWLLARVSDDYEALAARVAADTAHVKEEKERKRQERLAALRTEA